MALKRESTREQITQIILERILDGTYRPGERLIELQIAGELNTSQAPVREAFRYLEALRVVETEPYKGTRVRSITEQELEDSSQVRAVLEELGAQLAAPRPLADKGQLKQLEQEADAFMKAAQCKDVPGYSRHDIEFHRLIIEASGNQLLSSIWESVVLESRFRLTLKKIGEEQLCEFGEAHLPVLEAIKKGDGQAAGKLLKELICKYHFLKASK